MQVNGAYNFRATGNGISGFTPRNCSPVYVGATFAWNQLSNPSSGSPNGITYTVNADKTITVSGTASATATLSLVSPMPPVDHILYCSIKYVGGNTQITTLQTTGQNKSTTYLHKVVSSDYCRLRVASGQTPDETLSVFVTDITLAFGSTIADYAYTLESGNAGAGVAWLQAQGFFKNDYYAYDAVSLQNVETEKAINTGLDSSVHTYALGHTTLRGFPQLDADNNIYYTGDTYESNGKVTRKFGVYTFDGTESWSYLTNTTYPSFRLSSTAFTSKFTNAKVGRMLLVSDTKYAYIGSKSTWSDITEVGDCVIGVVNSTAGILVRDDAYTDATTFAASLNGKTVVYELSSATTAAAASFESLMFAEAGGTEQLVDYAYNHSTRDVEIPIGADNDYGVIRYAGYLLAVRDTQDAFTPIPLEYMRYESYNVAPDQRLDLDTTRDTTGVLHRTVLAHTATKVSFNVPSMPGWRIQELLGYFRTAFKQTNGDTQAHKLELKYYDEWEDDYKTGIMYMPDIQFQIRNIDGSTINYCETKVTFIEY